MVDNKRSSVPQNFDKTDGFARMNSQIHCLHMFMQVCNPCLRLGIYSACLWTWRRSCSTGGELRFFAFHGDVERYYGTYQPVRRDPHMS